MGLRPVLGPPKPPHRGRPQIRVGLKAYQPPDPPPSEPPWHRGKLLGLTSSQHADGLQSREGWAQYASSVALLRVPAGTSLEQESCRMWIFLSDAFISVVEHRDDASRLMVRARLKGDIERALPGVEAEETPDADYRYRAVVPRTQFAARVAALAEEIDYPNFKSSVPDKARHDAYMKVWEVMYREQGRQSTR